MLCGIVQRKEFAMDWSVVPVYLAGLTGQAGTVKSWGFDPLEVGKLPEGQRVEATGQEKVNAGDSIAQKGGVGLRTQVGAATAFDSFTVIPR
jgi:hypothetical protein